MAMSFLNKILHACTDTVLLPFDIALDVHGFFTNGDTDNTKRTIHTIGYDIVDGLKDASKGRVFK